MWLLNTATLELKDFVGAGIPPYAILSHTWGDDEVTFREMRKDREAAKGKAGYTKVQKCCEKALQDGHQYVWIDTCCIDKRSSAELSEAINSMYRWYAESRVCYAYLEDVPGEGLSDTVKIYEALSNSRWFTRGWTLQEMIAPCYIQFLGRDWGVIGVKTHFFYPVLQLPTTRINAEIFAGILTEITGVPAKVLRGELVIRLVPAAQKMAWAAKRLTTREEDLAYALMGLFGVSMPILYGEGLGKAFRRVQLEIIQTNTDQSIFVWRSNRRSSGLLADSPRDFSESGLDFVWKSMALQPYSMTNLGLALNLPVVHRRDGNYNVVFLRCWVQDGDKCKRIGLFLDQVVRRNTLMNSETELYRRNRCEDFEMVKCADQEAKRKQIYVLQDEQADHIGLIDVGFTSESKTLGNREGCLFPTPQGRLDIANKSSPKVE